MIKIMIGPSMNGHSFLAASRNDEFEYASMTHDSEIVDYIGDWLGVVVGEGHGQQHIPFHKRKEAKVFIHKGHGLYSALRNHRLEVEEVKS